MKKKIAIIGAGITGLSLAWFLQKKRPDLSITIFEAKDTVGGWIQTLDIEGALFETGPKALRLATAELIELIQDLGLQREQLAASGRSKKRYIVHKGKLCALPDSLFSLFFSTLGRKLLIALLREPFMRRTRQDDESVQTFFERRIGKQATALFISPLCAGIYAADPCELSMRSAFPKIWNKEQQFGSFVLAGLLAKKKPKPALPTPKGSFSFRQGLASLPSTLASKLSCTIRLNTQVVSIREEEERVIVQTSEKESFEDKSFDHVFATVTPALFSTLYSSAILLQVPQTSVVSVIFAYKGALTLPEGFGFLCPRHEDPCLLGCVFDSCLFPEQNGAYNTRLTFMMGGGRAPDMLDFSDEVLIAYAKQFAQKYLGISIPFDFSHISRAPNAISRYPVGHYRTLERLSNDSSRVQLIGSGLYGVSVGDSVSSAHKAANKF